METGTCKLLLGLLFGLVWIGPPRCMPVACAAQTGGGDVLRFEDFEDEDPVTFWATNGEYEVNFKGLTDERSYGGKRFKLVNKHAWSNAC